MFDALAVGFVLGDKHEAAVGVEETSGYGDGVYLFGVVDDFDFVFNVGEGLARRFL